MSINQGLLLGISLLLGPSVAQNALDNRLARTYRPLLRFDGSASDYCYPNHPSQNGQRFCQKSLNANAPIFWHVANNRARNPNMKQLCFWHFYAWQEECFGNEGSHAEDWERICVNLRRNNKSWNVKSYTFYQHSGWYTRCNIETNGKRPVVYVGKISHGSYHAGCSGFGFIWQLAYCQGGCGYWDDFRNPGVTWDVPASSIQHYSQAYGGGYNKKNSPKQGNRGTFNNVKCKGSSGRLLTTSGCWQDEVGSGSCTMF